MTYICDVIGNDWVFVARLLLAMLLGGLVGIERQARGRAAGLRTNILVCLGSAAVIVAFQRLSQELNIGVESAIRMDPARAAAGVITGIGFLGAGTIVKNKDFVRGLTTAASIWVVSAVGITVGLGEYVIAISLTLLVLLALYALHYIPIKADRYFTLRLKWHGDLGLLEEVIEKLQKERVNIRSRSITCKPNSKICQVILGLSIHHMEDDYPLIKQLQADHRFEEITWN